MARKSDGVYLDHILEYGNAIQEYVAGKRKRDFLSDTKTQHAIIRCYEVIGEAVKRLSDETVSREKSVPWKRVASMRDLLIHEYFNVNLDVVWDTTKKGLPKLLAAIVRLRRETKP